MSISLNVLDWRPIIEGDTVVAFVTTAMACMECARVVVGVTDDFVVEKETREVTGGRIGNIYWRSKGHDIAERCDLCGAERFRNALAEELRFFVEVRNEA